MAIAQQGALPFRSSAKPDFILATGHKGDILAVAFSPDGRWLAVVCSADRSVYLWSLISSGI
jgi:WD40 repeat protein